MIERNLLDVKKLLNYERKLPKDEREIYFLLRPYSRFFTKEEFESLYDAILLQKSLKQRLNQLKYFVSLGLETYQDVNKFLENELLKNRDQKNSKSFSFINLSSTYAYHLLIISLENKTNLELRSDCLTSIERDFIRKHDFDVNMYNSIKSKLGKESKNSIKTSIIEKYNISKEDVEMISEFIMTNNLKENGYFRKS